MNTFQTERAARRRRLTIHANLLHPDLLHSQWYLCMQFTSAHSHQFTDTHAVPTQLLNSSFFFFHRRVFLREERRLHPSSSHLGYTSEEMFPTFDVFDLFTSGFQDCDPFQRTPLGRAVVPLFRSPCSLTTEHSRPTMRDIRKPSVDTSTGTHQPSGIPRARMAMEYVWAVLVFFSCAVSVAACSWLLMSVGSRTGGRLLPVQLANLALADALYHTSVAWCGLDLFAGRSVNATMSGVMNFSCIVSWLMQVHIAVGFLALFWRLPRVMRVLQRTPYLTWLVSLPLAAFLSEFVYSEFPCFPGLIEVVTGCVVCVLYVMSWLRSWFYPLREEVRAHRMMWLFPLTFVVTYGPWIFFCYCDTSLELIGVPFAALNGFLNVLAYRCNSRFLGTTWPDMTDAPLTQWLGPSSRPVTVVAFPEVVTVRAEQRDALQESERQIVQLEERQAAGAEEDLD